MPDSLSAALVRRKFTALSILWPERNTTGLRQGWLDPVILEESTNVLVEPFQDEFFLGIALSTTSFEYANAMRTAKRCNPLTHRTMWE